MKQSKFDIIMDHIDENIQKTPEEIKKGIFDLILCNSNTFSQYFHVITGDTLGNYIRNRKLYFAAMELLRSDKPICEIALDFGYSDQSAFTRAFSAKYRVAPGEIRTSHRIDIPNDKYFYEDFSPHQSDNYSDIMWREFERSGAEALDIEYLDEVERGKEYFDIDTCYAIADLAERLEIPIPLLMEKCFHLMIECESDPEYLTRKEMTMISLGIESHEELEAICKHYKCQYYALNQYMVMAYHGIEI